MSNENIEGRLFQFVENIEASTKVEINNLNARIAKITDQLRILTKRFDEINLDTLSTSDGEETNTEARFTKIMTKGMTYEELARYAAEGWSHASFFEFACDKNQELSNLEEERSGLSDECEKICKKRDKLFSMLEQARQLIRQKREVMMATIDGINASKTINASNNGKKRAKNDIRTAAKAKVKEEWADWQAEESKYKGKTDFANKMLVVHGTVLSSPKVITDWCRTWEKM